MRFAKINGRYVALEHENGDRMLDRETPVADIKAAHVRLIATPAEAALRWLSFWSKQAQQVLQPNERTFHIPALVK